MQKLLAIIKGLQLPDRTLKHTDVLVGIDFNSPLPHGPVRANTHFARRLSALREFVGMTLEETIRAMKTRPNVPWTMRDYHCHVPRGRCIVARDGKRLDHKGNLTDADAEVMR